MLLTSKSLKSDVEFAFVALLSLGPHLSWLSSIWTAGPRLWPDGRPWQKPG